MRYMLILLGLLVANAASAIDCQKLPSCEELGYLKEEVKGCADGGYVLCPFDEAYKKCVNYDCEALGFTESDKTLWCADLIKCAGNPQMTLCQKPCLATNYQELKELAESGKCKVVTMRNDITIPLNESLTLHADTIIDGGNHTLASSGNKNLVIFSMKNKTGMKNIKLRHTQTETQENLYFLAASSSTDHVFLENIDIVVSSNDNVNHWAPVLTGGTFEISGKFALDIQALWHMVAFGYNSANFNNAQVSVKITGTSGDMFVNANVTFTNSSLYTNISGVSFTQKGSVTFKNSKAELHNASLFWGEENDVQNVLLDGSSFTFLSSSVFNMHSIANITLQNTSVLNLTFEGEPDTLGGQTNIITTNLADTLVVNGTTYRPTIAATTKLSEIESSRNWEKVSQ